MKKGKRDTIFQDTSNMWFSNKEHTFIEVSRWTNGDGVSIAINDNPVIDLQYVELEVINTLVGVLQHGMLDKDDEETEPI